MCGRFALYSPPERYERLLGVDQVEEAEGLPTSWNIAPTIRVPAVTIRRGLRTMALYRWGLVPYWSESLASGARAINARAETVATKPSFRSAFRYRRALVPADLYFEWQTRGSAGKSRQPFALARSDGEPLVFAGLWESWRHPEGAKILTCSIITTTANSDIADLHDRMPAILDADTWDRWIDPELEDRDELEGMLRPACAGTLKRWPVDPRVGSVKNDDPNLIQPYDAPVNRPQQLDATAGWL